MTPGQVAAAAAMDRADAAGRVNASRESEVSALAAQMRHARERNHFSEAISELYRGGDR